MTSDLELQSLLSAVTDALLADEQADLDGIIRQYDVPRTQVDSLVWLIQRLHMTLVGAQPSKRFVRRLKHDLIGTERGSVVARIRYLPPRVQIAAAVALVVGFMLLTYHRLLDESRREKRELPALQ
jgi:hypothetical protein